MSNQSVIAQRYVSALFALVTEQNSHDRVKADMLSLKSLFARSEQLRKLLVNPIISREQTEKAVDSVLAALDADQLTRKFFALLARNRRLAVAPAAIDAYLAMLAESRGELTVQVTTAQKLDTAETRTLTDALSKATGKVVELRTSEDPALIGGLQIRIGSRLMDGSVTGTLERLRQTLKAAA